MVKVREEQPVEKDGSLNLVAWLNRLQRHIAIIDPERLSRAAEIARIAENQAIDAENIWAEGNSSFLTGLEMCEILAELHLDEDSLTAAVLYRTVREGKLELSTVQDQFGPEVARLISGVQNMAAIHYKHKQTRKAVLGQRTNQSDNVRKMLVNMIDDVRVALIKIAERTCAIRAVKHAPASKKYRVAREVFDIYAPLAHRLGLGKVKWELEDLSFRYIEPNEYKKIARRINEKRLQREAYIEQMVSFIKQQLDEIQLDGHKVRGRVKHIYSIWRKMRRKNLPFSQVYDTRAVRILVNNVADCYRVLGLVQNLWRQIPSAFDDYIANPKPNGYRSLHAAVIGPEGKVVEIQIRTHDMHEEAELGVAAHWRYKGSDEEGRSQSYEEKIAWLRQVLEWHEEVGTGVGPLETGDHIQSDRIYVLTPEGHVVDLPMNAMPLDFAYKIHTEVGHSCRAVKVNGVFSPLNKSLHNGDQVEIIASKESRPSRDWLNPDLGYVQTSSAKAKISQWFKDQARDQQLTEGRLALHRELYLHGLPQPDLHALSQTFKHERLEEFLMALGRGDITSAELVRKTQKMLGAHDTEFSGEGELGIIGAGGREVVLADCCEPTEQDSILGELSPDQKIVKVHRADCAQLLSAVGHEHRIHNHIALYWGQVKPSSFTANVELVAWNRTGLLRDIFAEAADLEVDVASVHTQTNKVSGIATMQIEAEVDRLERLNTLIHRLNSLPNIISVQRKRVTE